MPQRVVSESVSDDKDLIQVFLIVPEDSLPMIITLFFAFLLFLSNFISYPFNEIIFYMDSH